MNRAVIIFSGYNQRAIIAFLRTLSETNSSYGIIAASKEDPILLTSYKSSVYSVRKSLNLDLSDIIDNIEILKCKLKADEFIIAPSTEALNRFLLQHKEMFEKHGCQIPLVEKKIYEAVSDKEKFGKVCINNNIIVPREIEKFETTNIPFVAKPKSYFAKDGAVHNPYLIFSELDKKYFLDNCNPNDFYYQEYLTGKSYYLLYYISKSGKNYKYSQENLIQQPNGKSIVAAVSSDFHKSEESKKYEKLFQLIGFNGLVMVEVRQNNDQNYMIEANPRFWGPSQLFVDAKMNFFEAFLYENNLINQKPHFLESKGTYRYFWFGGISAALRNGKELTYHYFKKERLFQELPLWLKADIYRRKDTFNIFNKEFNPSE